MTVACPEPVRIPAEPPKTDKSGTKQERDESHETTTKTCSTPHNVDLFRMDKIEPWHSSSPIYRD